MRAFALAVSAVAFALSACGDGSTEPEVYTVGVIVAELATSGLDQPSRGGVTARLQNGPTQFFPEASPMVFPRVAAGQHTLTLGGIVPNCSLQGAHPRTLTVATGKPTQDTVRTTFELSCVAVSGVILAELASSGLDQPNRSAVTVSLQGGSPLSFGETATPMVFGSVAAGQHTLRLDGAGSNCSVQGDNPRTVSIAVGTATRDTARTTYEVSCVAASGVVEVTVTTTGDDRDVDGYSLRLDNTRSQSGVRDGLNHVSGVGAGEHEVSLEGIAGNCTLENGPQRVSVTTGGTTRDTARTAFQVTCVDVPLIAFSRSSGQLYDTAYVFVAQIDGSAAQKVGSNTPGHSASWSPDGQRLVLVTVGGDCYYECDNTGLAVIDLGSGKVTQLTTLWTDWAPAWSPDGTRIAFARDGDIMVMNADGSSVRTLVRRDVAAGRQSMGSPAWSPDGTRIAFTCVTNAGWSDICLALADGTGIVRLSSDPWYDADPSWSPDGTRLALTTDRGANGVYGVAVMDIDGSNLTRLADGGQPAWSRDGTRILFGNRGIFSISPDGTNLTRVTSGFDSSPAWQP